MVYAGATVLVCVTIGRGSVIGSVVRERREARGWSQEHLAGRPS